MKPSVSHDRNDESMEAKVRWFQSLTMEERMELLCEYTELALSINPHLPDQKDAEPAHRRVQILSKT